MVEQVVERAEVDPRDINAAVNAALMRQP